MKREKNELVGSSLTFDNLNFKLAVLNQLIFAKQVFSPTYDFGDLYESIYGDDGDDGVMSKKYAERALYYFRYLEVPSELAKHITHIHASVDDEIYYEINPLRDLEDEHEFYINEISTREAGQQVSRYSPAVLWRWI